MYNVFLKYFVQLEDIENKKKNIINENRYEELVIKKEIGCCSDNLGKYTQNSSNIIE